MPKLLLLTLLISVLLPFELFGQTSQKVSFSCFYWQGLPKEDLFYRNGEKIYPLQFKKAIRSGALELEGMTTFEIYRKAEQPKDDEPPFTLLAKTNIPNAKQVLFVIIPFEQAGKPTNYQVFALNDSLLKFPPGSFQFVNFTSQNLFVSCAGTSVEVFPQNVNVVRPNNTKGGFVPFSVYDRNRKQLFGTRIFGQPKGRELVFISPPSSPGKRPRVKFVTELIQPKKKPQTTDSPAASNQLVE